MTKLSKDIDENVSIIEELDSDLSDEYELEIDLVENDILYKNQFEYNYYNKFELTSDSESLSNNSMNDSTEKTIEKQKDKLNPVLKRIYEKTKFSENDITDNTDSNYEDNLPISEKKKKKKFLEKFLAIKNVYLNSK